ncbi:MAG TPA: EamA family transporter [Synergistaceae bacterium]|nr:EamA family transporter [Synergistaceae bacterium]
MKNRSERLAYAAAIGHTFITGLSFMFSKIGLGYSTPWDLLAYRFTASFIAVMIPVALRWISFDFTRERVKKILPLALFYPLSFFAFQTFGLQYLTSSEASILLASMPVSTLILASYFLREETSLLQKLSVMLSVAGVVYITANKGASLNFTNIKGVTMILLSALSFSVYSILVKKLARNFTILEMSYIMIVISFIFFNAMSLARHVIKGTAGSFFAPLSEPGFIVAFVYLGVLSSLVTSLLTNYALSKIDASKMCVFTNLSTVISIIAGVVFLKENIYFYHLIGSLMIISGVVGTNCFCKRDKNSCNR